MTDSIPTLQPGKYCFYVPDQDPNEHGGYVPSVVVEGQSGHYPLLGNGYLATPWVWGRTLAEARNVAASRNESMGLTADRVNEIVARSMFPRISRTDA